MGRFAAIGGGTFEETDELVRKTVSMTRKKAPNILYIGTAAQDSTNPLTSAKKSFKRVCPGVTVKKLFLIRNVYTEEEIDGLLDWADVIYVGPGDTEFMLTKWKEFGLSEKLVRIFRKDTAVLSGMSAGAICWFSLGYTDSDYYKHPEDWSCRMFAPGIDLYDAAFCPHYQNSERKGFGEACGKAGKKGIALTDGAAFFYDNGTESFAFSLPGAEAYLFGETGEAKRITADTT